MKVFDEVLAWLRDNSTKIGSVIELDEWFSESLPGFYRARMRFQWKEFSLDAQGIGTSEQEAIVKCLAEYFERIVVRETKASSSNGFAAHINSEEARRRSLDELLERDAFFSHYLTRTPFEAVDYSAIHGDLHPSILQLFKRVQAKGFDLRFGMMTCLSGRIGIIAAASNIRSEPKFGVVFSTACGDSRTVVLNKVGIELAGNLAWLLGLESIEAMSNTDFVKLTKFRAIDHRRLGFHLDQRQWFETMFLPKDVETQPALSQELNVEFVHHKIPENFDSPPFFIVQAKCPSVQRHFFGLTTEDKVNIPRLSMWKRRKFSVRTSVV
jgi:hypothetical protein